MILKKDIFVHLSENDKILLQLNLLYQF